MRMFFLAAVVLTAAQANGATIWVKSWDSVVDATSVQIGAAGASDWGGPQTLSTYDGGWKYKDVGTLSGAFHVRVNEDDAKVAYFDSSWTAYSPEYFVVDWQGGNYHYFQAGGSAHYVTAGWVTSPFLAVEEDGAWTEERVSQAIYLLHVVALACSACFGLYAFRVFVLGKNNRSLLIATIACIICTSQADAAPYLAVNLNYGSGAAAVSYPALEYIADGDALSQWTIWLPLYKVGNDWYGYVEKRRYNVLTDGSYNHSLYFYCQIQSGEGAPKLKLMWGDGGTTGNVPFTDFLLGSQEGLTSVSTLTWTRRYSQGFGDTANSKIVAVLNQDQGSIFGAGAGSGGGSSDPPGLSGDNTDSDLKSSAGDANTKNKSKLSSKVPDFEINGKEKIGVLAFKLGTDVKTINANLDMNETNGSIGGIPITGLATAWTTTRDLARTFMTFCCAWFFISSALHTFSRY